MAKKMRVSTRKKSKLRKSVKRKSSPTKTRLKKTGIESILQEKKDALSRQEVVVETVKFTHAKQMAMQGRSLTELPSKYGRDTMVLAVRDP